VRDQSAFALLRHVGEDIAGAAQLVRPDRVQAASEPGPVIPVCDEDVADRLGLLRSDPVAWGPAAGGGQFSLAGAQPKFALHYEDGQWGIPTGRTPTTHIIKPAIRELADQDITEHMSMRAARLLGLSVPETEIRVFGEERAFVVRRYDRVRTESGWLRVHQEDMCQSLGAEPTAKYEDQGGPSAIDIARLVRRLVTGGSQEQDVRRFADALIYNWVIAGTDAHAKNYAFLLAPGQVRLAPFYDLNSYLPYRRPGHAPRLSMKIGSYKTRPEQIVAADWGQLARDIRLDADELLARVGDLARAAPDAFSSVAAEDSMRALASPLPARLVDDVAVWAAERVASLAERGAAAPPTSPPRPGVA
jgi:serine/threonine-protein kinase HipA